MEPFFDLASLTKPLVTAPLVLKHLELDEDGRARWDLEDWPCPLTPRALLCHAAGLPPWLPYEEASFRERLARRFPPGLHPLLRPGSCGTSVYSDVGYGLLGAWIEQVTGRAWRTLGAEATGLFPWPYPDAAVVLPDAQDAEAWRLGDPHRPLPPQGPGLPHDANARAGMVGHAGFGGTPRGVEAALHRWWEGGWPRRMAVIQAHAEDGLPWGLGLHRISAGPGHFGSLLARVPPHAGGIHLQVDLTEELAPEFPPLGTPEWDTPWWGHFGFTGGALFLRPDTGLTFCLLVHRRGPDGELLDLPRLRARRWKALEELVSRLGG